MPRGQRTGHHWRQARAWIFDTYDTCCICGRPVDKTLPFRDEHGRINRWSKSVHHLIPLAAGGGLLDYANLRLAHLGCNASLGARIQTKRNTSLNW